MNQLLAVSINPPTGTGKYINDTFPTLSSIVTVILKNSITLAGILFLLLLIFGGLMFIIGAGNTDSKKAAQGKALITDALIGFVVVLMAFFIVQIIETVTGIKILNPGI